MNYAYNIRGWLTGVKDAALTDRTDLWGLELSYDQGFTVNQYNGNIAGQRWRSKSDNVERAYGYQYDGLNRLLQGDFVARTTAGAWTAEKQDQRLWAMSYDANGNILSLRRRGLLKDQTRTAGKRYGPTDALSYAYQGNRLLAVDDAVTQNAPTTPTGAGALQSVAGDFQEKSHYDQTGTTEYGYDANGNLTRDANKGISQIAYNHLNLPRRIQFGTGADNIVFRYAASGQKVQKRVYQTNQPMVQTDYLGANQYEGDSLRFLTHPKGDL